MKAKESVAGIRGLTAPQAAYDTAGPSFPIDPIPQGRSRRGPRKKSGAGPVKATIRKEP